jgi:hypothetical protein
MYIEDPGAASQRQSGQRAGADQMRRRWITGRTKLINVATNAEGRSDGAQFHRAHLPIEPCEGKRFNKLVAQ